MNAGKSQQSLQEEHQQPMDSSLTELPQSKPFENHDVQQVQNHNIQKINFESKKVRFDSSMQSGLQLDGTSSRAQNPVQDFKSFFKRPESSTALNFSVAETQNDSMDTQKSSAQGSVDANKVLPRLGQIFNGQKRAPPGLRSNQQRQMQEHVQKHYTSNMRNMGFLPPQSTNQQNQSQAMRTTGPFLQQFKNQAVNFNQRNDLLQRNFRIKSPEKRQHQTKAQGNLIRVNQSPLIENYRTQHISYDGLETPLNLISPPKESPNRCNQIQHSDIHKRLFQEQEDFAMMEALSQQSNYEPGLSGSAGFIGSGLMVQQVEQATGGTSNLQQSIGKPQSILSSIYRDQQDEEPNDTVTSIVADLRRLSTKDQTPSVNDHFQTDVNPSRQQAVATPVSFHTCIENENQYQLQAGSDNNEENLNQLEDNSLQYNVCPAKSQKVDMIQQKQKGLNGFQNQPFQQQMMPQNNIRDQNNLTLYNDLPEMEQFAVRTTFQPYMKINTQSSKDGYGVETNLGDLMRQSQVFMLTDKTRRSKKRPLEVLYSE